MHVLFAEARLLCVVPALVTAARVLMVAEWLTVHVVLAGTPNSSSAMSVLACALSSNHCM